MRQVLAGGRHPVAKLVRRVHGEEVAYKAQQAKRKGVVKEMNKARKRKRKRAGLPKVPKQTWSDYKRMNARAGGWFTKDGTQWSKKRRKFMPRAAIEKKWAKRKRHVAAKAKADNAAMANARARMLQRAQGLSCWVRKKMYVVVIKHHVHLLLTNTREAMEIHREKKHPKPRSGSHPRSGSRKSPRQRRGRKASLMK